MRTRFQIPDFPKDRPTVPEVRALVAAYYEKPGNGAGGKCHIVLDDGNLEDLALSYCVLRCLEEKDLDGFVIMSKMLQMTKTQRRKVCR